MKLRYYLLICLIIWIITVPLISGKQNNSCNKMTLEEFKKQCESHDGNIADIKTDSIQRYFCAIKPHSYQGNKPLENWEYCMFSTCLDSNCSRLMVCGQAECTIQDILKMQEGLK